MGFKLSVIEWIEKGEMTYKQAQAVYGIQVRSTVLVWLRKHGKLDWSSPSELPMSQSKETPAQQIKRLEREHPKKAFTQGAKRLQLEGKISLTASCRLLGISRQAVYQQQLRQQERKVLLEPVKGLVLELRRYMPRLGTRKLYFLLKPKLEQLGIKIGRDGLFDYLRENNLLVKPKRSYTKTTYSRHWMKKYPNLLQTLEVKRPEQVFVSDITYVESDEGVHYLSLVTDASSRKILGHELSYEMKASDTVKALEQAVSNRETALPLLHHSDRGSQYCSALYQSVLKKHQIKPSMMDGYDCYQNALAECNNGILKQEFLIYR